jgi:Carboxypeptidase regulatory-like domain
MPRLEITGIVRNRDGSIVAGATVAITESTEPHRDVAAITTANGTFRLSGLRPGQYVLEARKGPSLAHQRVSVGATSPTVVEMHLE